MSVHKIYTRNKHHLHRPAANLSYFQKGASYSVIRIFNNLPRSITSLKNEKAQFKVALKSFYMHTSFTLWVNFLHVLMLCITDLYDCVNPYSVIFLYFCMFMTCSTSYCLVTTSGFHECMYVRMYVCMYSCMYVYMYICMNVCMYIVTYSHNVDQRNSPLLNLIVQN